MFDQITIERFWSKVDECGPDECWPWIGARHYSGYGRFRAPPSRKSLIASRVALMITVGMPTGIAQQCCHSCDNPPCCNPAHLRWGTNKENAADRTTRKRNRDPKGEDHYYAKLTADAVNYMRKSGESTASLAERFNVNWKTAWAARTYRSWRLLP